MSNILIVEADPIVRNLMIHLLVRQGHNVYEAANTREALQLCESIEPVDLLIADHEITDGEVTRQIVANCANTKVLHISKESFDLSQSRQALLPGSSFLKKPFTPVELLDSVQNLLNPRMH